MKIEIYQELAKVFLDNNYHLYLVGGCVRDLLLSREVDDLDVVSDAHPEQIMSFINNVDSSFAKFGSVTVFYKHEKIDITTLRKEEYDMTFRKPSRVEYIKDISIDSLRRDFTINALYMDETLKVFDFHNGESDLKNKVIRMIGEPSIRIKEDPIRILRCLRFMITLDFKIEESLDSFIKNNLNLLHKVSRTQIHKEIEKMKKISFSKYQKVVSDYHLDDYLILEEKKRELNVIDLHCDTLTRCYAQNENIFKNSGHIDIKKMNEGEYLLQCFAIFINLEKQHNPYHYFSECYNYYLTQLEEYSQYVVSVTDLASLNKAKSENKIGLMLTIEEGEVLQGDLSRLDDLYSKGVRMITLTWNYENSIGCPALVNQNKGLTQFGKDVVKRMNELGMIIDTSHLSDQGFKDVISISNYPIVASHSCSRAIQDFPRNVSDEMMELIHQNNGVVGMNYCPDFVSNNSYQLLDIVHHIKHWKDLGYIDNIALGSDFDGIPTPNPLNSGAKMNLLKDELYKEGFTQKEIKKIFHENFLRVMKKVLK